MFSEYKFLNPGGNSNKFLLFIPQRKLKVLILNILFMKTNFLMAALMLISFMCYNSVSAQKAYKTIKTDDGEMTVYLSPEKEQYLEFDVNQWNEMFKENKFGEKSGPFINIRIEICIRIASRKRDCDGGIGFRCKPLYPCDGPIVINIPKGAPVKVLELKETLNRTFTFQYELQKDMKIVRLYVPENLNWDSLL